MTYFSYSSKKIEFNILWKLQQNKKIRKKQTVSLLSPEFAENLVSVNKLSMILSLNVCLDKLLALI